MTAALVRPTNPASVRSDNCSELVEQLPIQPLLPVIGANQRVPLVSGGSLPYANLDYAASAPALEEVAAHVTEILPFYASVHRGAGYSSQVSTAVYEGARDVIARFVGAREDDVVVFTRHTTDALNLLSGCVPAANGDRFSGGDVVCLDLEHHANLLPWRRRDDGSGPGLAYRCVAASDTIAQTLADLDAALAARPAALLAVTGASNVTGEVLPIDELAAIAHRHGARIVVDAAQLAPHRRIDMAAAGIDYLVFSGHKLYAPFGAGVLIGRRDWLDEGEPHLAGGGAVTEVSLTDTRWASAPQRHEGGTPNVVGAAALARACQVLDSIPAEDAERHEAALTDRLTRGLSAIEGVSVHRVFADSADPIGVVTFSLDGADPGALAAYLSAEHGIGVRDGKFCAHPLLSRLGIADGAVRASLGVGSSSSDVDRLVAAVGSYVTSGPDWTYARLDGRWCPSPDPRPRPTWATATGGVSPCTS